MDVVHQEHAFVEARQGPLEGGAIEAGSARSRGAFESVEHPRLVALGLQSAEEPGATIREALVVEVDGILGREHTAEAERAGLLQQRQHRRLARRIRGRRKESEDLVHVEQRAQRLAARLGSHPGDELAEQERHDEHALRIREMSDRDDREPWASVGSSQHAGDVEGLAFEPGGEARRCEQIVDAHRKRPAFGGGKEGLELEDADALDRRLLDLVDQAREVEVAPFAPGALDEVREQDVLTALDRIGVFAVDAHESEQARDG